jgi:hypothetical protein
MEASSQLHALHFYLPGKKPVVAIEQEAKWDPEPVWTFGEEIKFIPVLGIEYQIIQSLTFIQILLYEK